MRNKITTLFIAVTMLMVTGCGKGDGPKTPTPVAPGKVALTFPAQNSACTTGTVISSTQSSLTLIWGVSVQTDSYEVDIKNLLTGAVTTQTTTTAQLTVTLSRNTPYSWSVISRTNKTSLTAQSDTWKFYNSGIGAVSYPPFPAEAVSPMFAQNLSLSTTTNLSWTGSDADNDIAGYDVYFGTTTSPSLLKSNVSEMFLNNITIAPGNTYYWKIVTKDLQGNASDSNTFQFTVK